MRHLHITRELLHAVANEQSEPRELAKVAYAHLVDLCPVCKAELEAYEQDCVRRETGSFGAALEHAFAAAEAEAIEISEERQRAGELLEKLLALPASDRLTAIEAQPLVYRGPALAELLLEHGSSQLPGRPQEALATAQLAQTVLHHSSPSSYATELFARATAHAANALRISGRLPEAEALFGAARFILRDAAGGDRLIRAEFDNLEGLLRKGQRRFEQAQQLLSRAALSYEAEGAGSKAARVLINLGIVLRESGSPDVALALEEQAIGLLSTEQEPRLCLYARHNLADCLCDLGRFEEAREAVLELGELYARYGDPLSHLRLAWLEGKISRGLGELDQAEGLFAASRHGFLARGIAYDAALVSLELAGLYLEQGRTVEVKALASEMVTVFKDLDIHREALAAVLLFRDAAELEQVSIEFVRRLASYLPRAERDPAFAFQIAS